MQHVHEGALSQTCSNAEVPLERSEPGAEYPGEELHTFLFLAALGLEL
jgi:hypothetical protein